MNGTNQKQTDSLVDLEQEIVHKLLHVSDLYQINLQRLLREYDLTLSQFQVLKILADEGQPLPCLEIASRTLTVTPGITGLIDRLEKAELVHRKRCNKDRRVVYIEMTEKALDLVTRLNEPVRELYLTLSTTLTKSQLKQFRNCLIKLGDCLS